MHSGNPFCNLLFFPRLGPLGWLAADSPAALALVAWVLYVPTARRYARSMGQNRTLSA